MNFAETYNILWSIGAIILGIVLLFFSRSFLKANQKAYENLDKKRKFWFFQQGSKTMREPYMKVLAVILGLIFLLVGILGVI
ncbi:MAG: hypothetical protein ABIO57_04180 [Candidatus Paceibacterota bacterium]